MLNVVFRGFPTDNYIMIKEVDYKKLKRSFDISTIDLNKSVIDSPTRPLIGQDRALEALEFGIGNKGGGFNIYVSGYPGSGKLKAVNHFLEEKAKVEEAPGDWCYVNNFKDPYCPKKLALPKGGAEIFRDEINKIIEEGKQMLIKAFESKEYADKRQQIISEYQQQEVGLFEDLYRKASVNNFIIQRTPIEILVIPVDNAGNPLNSKKFRQLSEKKRKEILDKQTELHNELITLLKKNRELERARHSSLMELEKNVALYAIETILEELKEKYKNFQDVLSYLDEVKNDILDNLEEILVSQTDVIEGIGPERNKKFIKYEVNVITDNAKLEGAPIIMELNPTYNNLFGKVEHESQMGTLITNFTLIRGGALHRANGGYLILPLKELLLNYFSWDSLKRALSNNEIVIEDPGERLGFFSAKSLKPDPIPLDVQIILIGSPIWYYLLYEYDEEFKELFKVKAEFDTTMAYNSRNVKDFAGVTYKILEENNLLPLEEKAMARLIEQAARMAGDQKKLSLKFREIRDILHEADHYSRLDSSKVITVSHVLKAIEARYFRSNLIQEKINEMIKRNTLMIPVSETRVGQINGLSVIDLGDITFGKPNKITVSIASGKLGLVDIEREAKLGGKIHTKGVLILQGYLLEKYAQNKSMSLIASLVFEQSYSEIEGDSASSAELFAILSSLSGLPIKQGIAVTGSVNQKGEIQPVGAINEKIEGYFEVCKQGSLTGDQGVIIPAGNLDNLMLKDELVQAVK
ncbi:MAG: AAA family ATPase, partial [Flavobacteriaceae bacterium]|nr:AAA family ATPase [Flavobacteriaceae bacterium]